MEGWLYDLYRLHLESTLSFLIPLFLCMIIVGIILGLIKIFTSIKDHSISYAGRLLALSIVLMMFGASLFDRLQELATRAWSGGLTP